MNEPQMNYMKYGHYSDGGNINQPQMSQIEYISMLDGFNPNQAPVGNNMGGPYDNNNANANGEYNDREQKRGKQEEYKKMLDYQRQEELNRIANEKQGMIAPQNISQSDRNQPIGRNTGNVPWNINESDMKERKRQQKMEYHQLLQQQIEEKNKEKEKEKKKAQEEDMKFEMKYNQMNNPDKPIGNTPGYRKGRHRFNQMLTTDELMQLQQQQMIMEQQQQQQRISQQEQQRPPKDQYHQMPSNNNPSNYATQQYSPQYDIGNTQQSSSYQRNSQSFNNTTSHIPPQIIHQQHYSSQMNNDNFHNTQQYNYDQYPPNNNKYQPQSQHQDQYYNRQSNQFPPSNTTTYIPPQRSQDQYPQQQYYPQRQQDPPMNMTLAMTQKSNQPQIPMMSYEEINNMFLKFMSNQMALLAEYESKVDRIYSQSHHRSDNDLLTTLRTEKNNTIDHMRTDQDNLKSCLGFSPMLNEFNHKMSSLLDIIIEKKIEKVSKGPMSIPQRNERIQSAKASNSNINPPYQASQEMYHRNYEVGKSNNMPIQSKVFNTPVQQKNYLPVDTSQINRDIQHVNYRSKYEDLKQSIMNFDDAMPEIKQSLIGFSKMVHANNINSSQVQNSTSQNLYQSWKGERKVTNNKDGNVSKLEAITEEINKDPNMKYNDDYENNNIMPQYNMSQSKILMTKSNDCTMTEKSFDQNLNLQTDYNNQQIEPDAIQEMMDKDNNIRRNEQTLSKSISRRNENICNPNFYIEEDDDNYHQNIQHDQHLDIPTNDSYPNSQSMIKQSLKTSIHQKPKEEEVQEVQEDQEEINEYANQQFDNEKTLEKLTKKVDTNLNLEDYNDIRESQKFQTQLNFFDDSYIDNANINKSKQHIINPTQNNNNKKLQRPQSPKLKANNNRPQVDTSSSNQSRLIIDKSQNCTNPMIDSYGDNILKDLDKYRQMALDQSSIQKSYNKK